MIKKIKRWWKDVTIYKALCSGCEGSGVQCNVTCPSCGGTGTVQY